MPAMEIAGNFFLIGLMGAGKSTAGRLLAQTMGREFYDSDDEIVKRTGASIPTIFEIEGSIILTPWICVYRFKIMPKMTKTLVS